MTKREAVIVSAYTGYLIGPFSAVQEYVESIFGHPVFTHEFTPELASRLREHSKVKADFLALSENLSDE